MDYVFKVKQDNTPHCPVCDHHLDCHTGAGHNGLPSEGDVSICLNCVSVLVYIVNEEGINLRLPTEEENSKFFEDENVQKAIQAVKQIKSRTNGPN